LVIFSFSAEDATELTLFLIVFFATLEGGYAAIELELCDVFRAFLQKTPEKIFFQGQISFQNNPVTLRKF
jgi:hypothetical protein